MDNLKAWFKGLNRREQKLVMAASIIVVIGIFYFAIWSPLNSAINTQRTAVASDKALLTWINEQANRASILRQSASSQAFTGSLTRAVNQTSRAANIAIARMQPQGDQLVVSIDQVEFNSFVDWVSALERQGVLIIQSDVSEVDAQGFVQIRRLELGK